MSDWSWRDLRALLPEKDDWSLIGVIALVFLVSFIVGWSAHGLYGL